MGSARLQYIISGCTIKSAIIAATMSVAFEMEEGLESSQPHADS